MEKTARATVEAVASNKRVLSTGSGEQLFPPVSLAIGTASPFLFVGAIEASLFSDWTGAVEPRFSLLAAGFIERHILGLTLLRLGHDIDTFGVLKLLKAIQAPFQLSRLHM